MPDYQLQQGCLTGAIRAHHSENLARRDVQCHPSQHRMLTVGEAQAGDLDRWVGHGGVVLSTTSAG
ncbi:MAG: hypothetical protein V9G98_13985 [Candidatus Competibacter sp.]